MPLNEPTNITIHALQHFLLPIAYSEKIHWALGPKAQSFVLKMKPFKISTLTKHTWRWTYSTKQGGGLLKHNRWTRVYRLVSGPPDMLLRRNCILWWRWSSKDVSRNSTRKLERGLCLSRTKNYADYDSRGFKPATPVAGPATLKHSSNWLIMSQSTLTS